MLLSSPGHSGDVPGDFSPNPFFAKYVETFLPPIFNILAGLIEENELIAFRRHWAYEWQGLVDETGVKLTDRNLYFWWGRKSDKERVFATDTKAQRGVPFSGNVAKITSRCESSSSIFR